VYVSRHDFDDGDGPDGMPIALQTGYPYLADIRDTERDLHRQQQAAAAIFAAIKADGRPRYRSSVRSGCRHHDSSIGDGMMLTCARRSRSMPMWRHA
jgi:hypothetical protein